MSLCTQSRRLHKPYCYIQCVIGMSGHVETFLTLNRGNVPTSDMGSHPGFAIPRAIVGLRKKNLLYLMQQ